MQLAAQVNARGGRGLMLRVNLLPGAQGDEMLRRRALLPERAHGGFSERTSMPRAPGTDAYSSAGMALGPMNLSAGALSDSDCMRLQACLTGWMLPVTRHARALNRRRSRSAARAWMSLFPIRWNRKSSVPGLFAAGETLDVDRRLRRL